MKHDETVQEWQDERERLNTLVFKEANLNIQRFFALDTQAYTEGALSAKTKELLGLVASLVLRCDDCITYHVIRSLEEGTSRQEMVEAMNVSLVVGGSIVIPHLRRAMARMVDILDDPQLAPTAAQPPEPLEHSH